MSGTILPTITHVGLQALYGSGGGSNQVVSTFQVLQTSSLTVSSINGQQFSGGGSAVSTFSTLTVSSIFDNFAYSNADMWGQTLMYPGSQLVFQSSDSGSFGSLTGGANPSLFLDGDTSEVSVKNLNIDNLGAKTGSQITVNTNVDMASGQINFPSYTTSITNSEITTSNFTACNITSTNDLGFANILNGLPNGTAYLNIHNTSLDGVNGEGAGLPPGYTAPPKLLPMGTTGFPNATYPSNMFQCGYAENVTFTTPIFFPVPYPSDTLTPIVVVTPTNENVPGGQQPSCQLIQSFGINGVSSTCFAVDYRYNGVGQTGSFYWMAFPATKGN